MGYSNANATPQQAVVRGLAWRSRYALIVARPHVDDAAGVTILPHLPPELVMDAAALLLEAFAVKMTPLVGRGAWASA